MTIWQDAFSDSSLFLIFQTKIYETPPFKKKPNSKQTLDAFHSFFLKIFFKSKLRDFSLKKEVNLLKLQDREFLFVLKSDQCLRLMCPQEHNHGEFSRDLKALHPQSLQEPLCLCSSNPLNSVNVWERIRPPMLALERMGGFPSSMLFLLVTKSSAFTNLVLFSSFSFFFKSSIISASFSAFSWNAIRASLDLSSFSLSNLFSFTRPSMKDNVNSVHYFYDEIKCVLSKNRIVI